MASPKNKPISEVTAPVVDMAIAPDTNLEAAIADELLDSIDWQQVKTLMISKAKNRFFAWLTSSNNTPVNISQFPELSALPSSQDGEAA